MAQRHPRYRRPINAGSTRRRHRREKEPSFVSQLILGCLGVGAITWIATPQISAIHAVATSTPKENARRQASAFYRNCSEAHAAGVTPIYAGQPGYRSEMDGDHDGIACERRY